MGLTKSRAREAESLMDDAQDAIQQIHNAIDEHAEYEDPQMRAEVLDVMDYWAGELDRIQEELAIVLRDVADAASDFAIRNR